MNQLIDRICDDFELAWQQGNPVRIEKLLSQVDADARDQLLSLEISLRKTAGEQPSVAEYAARFPERLSLIQGACNRLAAVEETVDLKTNEHEITQSLSGDSSAIPQSLAPAERQSSIHRTLHRHRHSKARRPSRRLSRRPSHAADRGTKLIQCG